MSEENMGPQEVLGELKPTENISKTKMWERKLLDFSLRNSLLNFRVTKSSLQLLATDLGMLEDKLSDEEEFSIIPAKEDLDIPALENKIHEFDIEDENINSIVEKEFNDNHIRTFLDEEELEKHLKHLHRSARTSMEENGANTLFLALGFLEWYENERSENKRYAPIVMIPVDIVRNNKTRGYILRSRQEEAQINITLIEYLKQDHGIVIDGLDPLPEDEHGIDLTAIFIRVMNACAEKKGWKIVNLAFVGLFSFGQFVMWNDLHNRLEEIEANKVVASLIKGCKQWESIKSDITASNLDERVAPDSIAVPVSADSSQLLAVVEASRGESFVLHGPPGTGKSQTITNMIANALYNGKSVLFVAEKMAALSVVQKRLERIGLGPFCLELHSNKTNKTAVLSQLEKALEVGRSNPPISYHESADRLKKMRSELNKSIEALHVRRMWGCSLYEAIEIYEKYKDRKGEVVLSAETIGSADEEKIKKWKDLLHDFAISAETVGVYAESPVKCCRRVDYSFETKENVRLAAQEIVELSRDAEEMFALYCAALKKTGLDHNALKSEILKNFEPSVFDMDAAKARKEWGKAKVSWFLPKMLGQSKLIKELRALAKNQDYVTKDSIEKIYADLIDFNDKRKIITSVPDELRVILGSAFKELDTDWENLISSDKTGDDYDRYLEKIGKYASKAAAFLKEYDIDMSVHQPSDLVSSLKSIAMDILDNPRSFKDIITFNKAAKALADAGLGEVCECYKAGKTTAANVQGAGLCAIYYGIILKVTSTDPACKEFRGKQYDDLLLQFKKLISDYQELTVKELVAKLSANVPVSSESDPASSEIGILKKAIKNNGRMMPVRKLFQKIPALLRKLCPCMLMSPLSVAQYIDTSFPKFDLVVFDEASQLPTSEAVGTIARGENVIVVGDPKQLPPTSFFTANKIDDENFEDEDLESLLDDCLAISMPEEHLKWHYRSRHESLIAYSNMKYYEGKLYTFPSPKDRVSEVRLVQLDGVYDKGKTKQNRAEAEAIVKDIIERLSDEERRKDSIGVVTFSSVQQTLIEDMLTDELAKYPELDEYDKNSPEPIIIKNLENVQGDERDVILFSVGYGPDAEGKVSMNFGPLNKDGGWRRLNVAITRARKAMTIYSVLRPEQIDLDRTHSEGVAGLKGFLEFARNGKNLSLQGSESVDGEKDILVKSIAERLRERGYSVDTNIGTSAYRVDIGVMDPEDKDTYMLGILIDGKNCHAADGAYDRFVSPESVLRGLGWKIKRIWALDWLDDSDAVLDTIEAEIRK